jgi:hypothetical protein
MKQSVYTLTIILLLCIACSPDEQAPNYQFLKESIPLKAHKAYSPDNNDNPYDEIGRLYREAQLVTLSGSSIDYISWQRVDWQTFHAEIADSGLSQKARTSLLDFIHTIGKIQHEGYLFFYDSMVSYEAQIMHDTIMTDLDKQIILSFTSVIRHGNYPNMTIQATTGVEDEDWDLSIPNAFGAVQTILKHVEGEYSNPNVPLSEIKTHIQEQ